MRSSSETVREERLTFFLSWEEVREALTQYICGRACAAPGALQPEYDAASFSSAASSGRILAGGVKVAVTQETEGSPSYPVDRWTARVDVRATAP